MTPTLSIIIPVLNEARVIDTLLRALQPLRTRGAEVIVVDGGSSDRTIAIAAPQVDVVVSSNAGRAVQMNAGAARAKSPLLWFLHADSGIPAEPDKSIAVAGRHVPNRWGCFQIRLSGGHPLLRVIERAMNLRVRLTGVATGDHGLFVTRELFSKVGGFPEIPLMEDVAMSKLLRAESRLSWLPSTITTSSRRWESNGIIRTTMLMWYLRLLYFVGVSPESLARHYRNSS